MSKILVQTGLGYYKDQAGNIIAKAELPAGEHPLRDGFTYTEVDSQAALDAIVIWENPVEIASQQAAQKISGHIRQKAIAELIATGNLPVDFED